MLKIWKIVLPDDVANGFFNFIIAPADTGYQAEIEISKAVAVEIAKAYALRQASANTATYGRGHFV